MQLDTSEKPATLLRLGDRLVFASQCACDGAFVPTALTAGVAQVSKRIEDGAQEVADAAPRKAKAASKEIEDAAQAAADNARPAADSASEVLHLGAKKVRV